MAVFCISSVSLTSNRGESVGRKDAGAGAALKEGHELTGETRFVRRRDDPAFLENRLMPVFRNDLYTRPLHHKRIGRQDYIGIAAIEHLQRLPDIFPKDNFGVELIP